jgi:copper chaperone CopZ
MQGGLTEHLTLRSSKITGDGDRDRLETELSSLDGVRDVEVSPDSNTVDIEFDPTIVNATRLHAAVEQAGYTPDSAGDEADRGEAGAFLGSEMTGADSSTAQDTGRGGTDDGGFGLADRDRGSDAI